jgi:hypothetical protein
MKFRELITESTINNIEKIFGNDLLEFIDLLTFYIDFNDKQSKKELLKFKSKLKKLNLLSTQNVYKLVKLKNPESYRTSFPASASTEMLQGNMLKLMKNMLEHSQGDYYYLVINNAIGLDINKFGDYFLKNKEYLLNKYDKNDHKMAFFFETLESKNEQNEFIIFDKYTIKETISV